MTKSITELSAEYSEKARETHTIIAQRILTMKQSKICEETGTDKTKMSRLVNDDLELFASVLTILGLKVADADAVYCSKGTAEATKELLKHCFESPDYMKILFHG